jgi:hypothetical protein
MHVAGRKQFIVGNRVCIQKTISKHWDNKGTISKIRDSGKSYFVDHDIGRDTILRNNFFFKQLAAPFSLHEAAEKNRISSRPVPMPVPVAVPAVAVPAAREHPIRVHKQPVRFAP